MFKDIEVRSRCGLVGVFTYYIYTNEDGVRADLNKVLIKLGDVVVAHWNSGDTDLPPPVHSDVEDQLVVALMMDMEIN